MVAKGGKRFFQLVSKRPPQAALYVYINNKKATYDFVVKSGDVDLTSDTELLLRGRQITWKCSQRGMRVYFVCPSLPEPCSIELPYIHNHLSLALSIGSYFISEK